MFVFLYQAGAAQIYYSRSCVRAKPPLYRLSPKPLHIKLSSIHITFQMICIRASLYDFGNLAAVQLRHACCRESCYILQIQNRYDNVRDSGILIIIAIYRRTEGNYAHIFLYTFPSVTIFSTLLSSPIRWTPKITNLQKKYIMTMTSLKGSSKAQHTPSPAIMTSWYFV